MRPKPRTPAATLLALATLWLAASAPTTASALKPEPLPPVDVKALCEHAFTLEGTGEAPSAANVEACVEEISMIQAKHTPESFHAFSQCILTEIKSLQDSDRCVTQLLTTEEAVRRKARDKSEAACAAMRDSSMYCPGRVGNSLVGATPESADAFIACLGAASDQNFEPCMEKLEPIFAKEARIVCAKLYTFEETPPTEEELSKCPWELAPIVLGVSPEHVSRFATCVEAAPAKMEFLTCFDILTSTQYHGYGRHNLFESGGYGRYPRSSGYDRYPRSGGYDRYDRYERDPSP